MKKVSVVILNWNGAEMLRAFLPSVVKFTNNEVAEVCVADNGSTDNSVDVVSNEFPSVRLIAFAENYGFAEGYNRVMEFLDTEYVVLLNSDVEVTENWIEPILAFMEANPDVAACQPKILAYKDKERFEYAGAAGGYIDKYGYPFCRGRVFDAVETDDGQYDVPAEVFWASGAAMFVRRALYMEAGGLDSRFFAHMEEIDLCWRFLSRGYRLMCIPASKVYHVGGATLKKENPKKTYLFYLLKLDMANAKAVINARRDYLAMRDEFKKDREENLKLTVNRKIKYRYDFSIILKCKLLGKTTYSQLLE